MPAVQVARRLQIYHAEWIEITLVNLHRQNKVPLKIVTEMSCFCRVINDVTFAEKNMQLFFSAQCNGHSVTAQETDVSAENRHWDELFLSCNKRCYFRRKEHAIVFFRPMQWSFSNSARNRCIWKWSSMKSREPNQSGSWHEDRDS